MEAPAVHHQTTVGAELDVEWFHVVQQLHRDLIANHFTDSHHCKTFVATEVRALMEYHCT